ncbi:MAG: IS630 family transposase [bacterium]
MVEFLSEKQKRELKAEHRLEDKSRYADRIKAILLLDSGYTAAKVAELLLMDEKSVGNYRRRYEDGGLEELCVDEYDGKSCRLDESQLDELEKELRSKIYLTTAAVGNVIEERFGVHYCVSGITGLLHRIGFSYKKPKVIPGKANAEAQLEFLDRVNELKEAKSPNDPLLFMDGVHPQHNSLPAYGWLPVGEETPLKTNTGRKRLNLNGALDSETHEIHVHESETLNGITTIVFLMELEKRYPKAKNIYIIVDNAGYYKSELVQEFLRTSKIKLIYLPPYAPNLNLIERVWKFFKKKVLANRYYESFLEFKEACLDFFSRKNWRSLHGELASLLTENYQIIGA